jgi:hypothetical protein
VNEKTEKLWSDKWSDDYASTMRVTIRFSDIKAARNFQAFVNRRFPGFTTRDGNEVTIVPMKPGIARSLIAASGYLGEMTLEHI